MSDIVAETIVDIAVPVPVPGSFHYLVSPEIAAGIALGSVVKVPFGRGRAVHGFVLGFPTETGVERRRLKSISGVLCAEPLFDEAMLKFLRWVSEYYCHPLGEVISAAIPKQSVERTSAPPKRTRKSAVGPDDTLAQLEVEAAAVEKPEPTAEQAEALRLILDPNDKRAALVHGVTGSGKTEIYMSVVDAVLAGGKSAIILVPEIALTPQLLGRFSSRFPGKVAVLHSDLTPKERFTQWERIRQGKAKVVVGARSAVFAPMRDLGLIVVDEEHEGSFKQEDSFRYHARDVAVVRGALCGAKVLLGSATPSLESYANAQAGKYIYVQLKSRVQNRPMPKTHFVDLKDKDNWYFPDGIDKPIPWLSNFLVGKIGKALREKQQSMLFLNRLGFAHFLFCSDCGHTWRCNNCDVALTFYKSPPSLKCHYCGYIALPPSICDECQGTGLESMGLGTEQVEKELKVIFPAARIARMDRSVVKTRKDLEAILTRITGREVDIIVGTQMIAKGHDFPGIALVGIIVADASLNLPDFRAHERTFQIITQVSGRAGRAETPGEVVIQTINPEHPVLHAAAENRSDDFYRWELDARKQFGFPPHQRLAMLRFQHTNLKTVEMFSQEVVACARHLVDKNKWSCVILGPAEAPLARLKNLFRWQCLIKSDSVRDMQALMRGLSEYVASKKSVVGFAVDIDPINSL